MSVQDIFRVVRSKRSSGRTHASRTLTCSTRGAAHPCGAQEPLYQRFLNAIRFEPIGRTLALLLVFWSPFSGGPRVPSLLLAVLGLWLLAIQRGGLFTVQAQRRWGVIFLLLWLPMLLSLPGSYNPKRTLETVLALPLYYLAGMALIEAMRADRARRRLAIGIALVLLFWMADGFVQYIFGYDLLGIPLTEDGRVVGLFGTNLHLGTFAAVLLPIVFWFALERHAAFAVVALALSVAIVVLAGARMNLVMIAVAAGALLVRLSRRWAFGLLVAAALALAATSALSPVMQERFARAASVTRGLDFETVNYVLTDRLYIWETAWHMVRDRPLTGIGTGAFAAAYDRYATRSDDVFRSGHPSANKPYHTHQMYISILAESGLLGLAAIVTAFVLVVRWYVAAADLRRAQAWPWLTALLVAVFPINSQPVLYTHWWFPILLLLLCMGLAALDGDGNVRKPGKKSKKTTTK